MMRPSGYRRKGIASLPVAIFFIALVAAAFVGVGALASGQSGLASRQVGVENVLAARQQELGGLAASSSGNGMLQLTQNSGVATDIVYALAQTSGGQSASVPVNYAVSPGQTMTVNLTSLVESMFGGAIPGGLASVTLVTDSGLYITSQVQVMQRSKQVTTYQQEQVQQTGQKFVGYNVVETTNPLVGYNVVETTNPLIGYNVVETVTSSVQSGYNVIAHYPVTTRVLSGYDVYQIVAHTVWTCPSGWTNLGNGQCSQVATYNWAIESTLNPPPGAKIISTTTLYYWKWVTTCYWVGFCISVPVWTPYTVYLVSVPLSPTYNYIGAIKSVTYATQYVGFSSTCPSGYSCTPVYTTQTTYQSESLGQMSYCPSPSRFTGTTYSCTPVYSQQTTTINLGLQSSCPSSTSNVQYSCTPKYGTQTTNLGLQSSCPSGSQYSCTPEHQQQTTNLGTLSSCPSGSQYSCSAVYQSYTYTVTETVPVTQTVYYTALSTPVSSWLVGG
jgi:hypothetical protein